jgi:predicted ATP-grasp superfamily ATP-dependent carboligase
MAVAKKTLLILGASARAAAFSALRAGLVPTCVDLFADLDLAARARVARVEGRGYPDNLKHAALLAPPGPWMYTGALENRPELIAALVGHDEGGSRPLWGNGPEVLRAVRDPFRVASCLKEAGLLHPRCLPAHRTPPRKLRWLLKPSKGAGGRGIREWDADRRPVDAPHESRTNRAAVNSKRFYWQELVEGLPCSAVFIGDGSGARLLGATRQLVGDAVLGAKPFAYCGSIGPLALEAQAEAQFAAVGAVLAREFFLRGLFGVDAVLGQGGVWPVEVNPRYTASVEVLEHALGLSALGLHRAVFEHGDLGAVSSGPHRACRSVGKAILYAKADVRVPDTRAWLDTGSVSALPHAADIPHSGSTIPAGKPVLTVFAQADSAVECYRELRESARRFESQFR